MDNKQFKGIMIMSIMLIGFHICFWGAFFNDNYSAMFFIWLIKLFTATFVGECIYYTGDGTNHPGPK